MSIIRPVDSRDAERVQLAIERALAGVERPWMGGNDAAYWVVVAKREQFHVIADAMQEQTSDAAGERDPSAARLSRVRDGRDSAAPRDPQTPARVA